MSTSNQTEAKDKRNLYKTARARIGCAHFKADEFVSVEYYGQGSEGVHYFTCNGSAVYPEHHLSEFVL